MFILIKESFIVICFEFMYYLLNRKKMFDGLIID